MPRTSRWLPSCSGGLLWRQRRSRRSFSIVAACWILIAWKRVFESRSADCDTGAKKSRAWQEGLEGQRKRRSHRTDTRRSSVSSGGVGVRARARRDQRTKSSRRRAFPPAMEASATVDMVLEASDVELWGGKRPGTIMRASAHEGASIPRRCKTTQRLGAH